VTIIVLGSGLYLWLSRRTSTDEAETELQSSNAVADISLTPEAAK